MEGKLKTNKLNQNQRRKKEVLYDFYLKYSLTYKGFDWKAVLANSQSSHMGLLQLIEGLKFQFYFTSIDCIVVLKLWWLDRWLSGKE